MIFEQIFSKILRGNVWRSVWRICMWILGLGGPSAIHLKVKKWARLKETVYSSPNLKRNFWKTKSDLSLAKLIHTTLKTSSSLQVANLWSFKLSWIGETISRYLRVCETTDDMTKTTPLITMSHKNS